MDTAADGCRWVGISFLCEHVHHIAAAAAAVHSALLRTAAAALHMILAGDTNYCL